MQQDFQIKELENGMTLIGQPMPNVSSSAVTLNIPAGASFDPNHMQGAAAVLCEWTLRGAGGKTTRQLNEALDSLGCQHHESVRSHHLVFSFAQLGRNLPQALSLLADIIRRPTLDDSAFTSCRALIQQDLLSLEDDPGKKANMILRERYLPYPLGRCVYGNEESLVTLTAEDVRNHAAVHMGPRKSILSVAGNFDWDEFCQNAESLFGGWSRQDTTPLTLSAPAGGINHIQKDSAQTHIAFAYKSVPVSHPQFYAARMAEMILSGGMSSRLFTEVREKRGLVYHVSAQYLSLKEHAGMFVYAGTVPAKAQETFDVTVEQLRSIAEGIEEQEIERARTQLKSAMVMQGESTTARASALASDWYHLGRLRTLAEISKAVDDVTIDEVIAYANDFPARGFTILVIGPEMIRTDAVLN